MVAAPATSSSASVPSPILTPRLRVPSHPPIARRRTITSHSTMTATTAASTTPPICTQGGTVLSRKRTVSATPPGSGDSTTTESAEGGCACGSAADWINQPAALSREPITPETAFASASRWRAGKVHRAIELSADRTLHERLHARRRDRQPIRGLEVVDCGDQQRFAQERVVNALRVVAV